MLYFKEGIPVLYSVAFRRKKKVKSASKVVDIRLWHHQGSEVAIYIEPIL